MDVQWPGFDECQLTNITQDESGWTVNLDLPREAMCSCGATRSKVGYVTTSLHDLPRGHHHVRLHLRAVRWRCPQKCQAKAEPWTDIKAKIPSSSGIVRPSLTDRLWTALWERYLRGEGVASLVGWSGVGTPTLTRLLRARERHRLEGSRGTQHLTRTTHIGLDEKFWQGRVLCVVVNLTTGRLLELLPDREPDTLRNFLLEFQEIHGGQPVFVMDMWEPYRQVVQAVYKDRALIVADRFHIVAKIGEDLKTFARLLLASSNRRPQQLVAIHTRFLARLKGADAAPVPWATELQRNLLDQATALACQAYAMWDSDSAPAFRQAHLDWEWDVHLFSRWVSDVIPVGQVFPFGRLQYLLRLWRSEVYAYCDPQMALKIGTGSKRPSNGRTEALNSSFARFSRASGHRRRAAFARWNDVDTWDEQRQFERLWLRFMWATNVSATQHHCLTGRLRPSVPPCSCGTDAVDIIWSDGPSVADLPLGDQPVRSVIETGHWLCPTCGLENGTGSTWKAVTPRLHSFIQHERRHGRSWSHLQRQTGVSVPRLKRLADGLPASSPAAPPTLVGVRRFRWRRQLRWVIVDPRRNRLVELLPDGDGQTLTAWLSQMHSQGLQQVMVGSLAWCALVPQPLQPLVDRFGCMAPIHLAYREVVWRWTEGLPVATKRAPAMKNHRSILLANPHGYHRIDQLRLANGFHLRRPGLLERDAHVQEAHSLITQFRASVFSTGTVAETEVALTDWLSRARSCVGVRRQGLPATTRRSFHFAFQTAIDELQSNHSAVVNGLALQAAESVSLGGASRLIRSLKKLPGAQQPHFELFRTSSLALLGER